ncbi:SAV_2336 N-terminal domain-related protein [Streptomyces sp. NPDC057690]|uniref:SAV_2336 N-terminal domain-related protein n=1 Tax=Streptomyces sp. NPDC057690 TaxID=3346214 RepID=UPI0036A03736
MSTDFDRVLAALEGIGIEPTVREAAEALWLAAHISDQAGTSAHKPGRPAAPNSGRTTRAPRMPRPAKRVTPATLHAPTADIAVPADSAPSTLAIGVRVADAPALTHELELLRALRPLKRQVPSRHRVLLDETATAERSAEERLFLPATRPEPERWLSLALVMETGPTMTVWHSLVGELAALLQRTGAFRDIRLWHLHTAPDGSTGLHPQALPTSALHSPREILDPTGRQAVWCVSDCVSALWRDGRADRLLELWGRSGPLAIVQPLPQRLWRRTGLRPERVRLHTDSPGRANSTLRVASSDSSDLLRGPAAGTPVPVLELDASWLTAWTHLVTAAVPGGIPAVVTTTGTTRSAAAASDSSTALPDPPPDDPLSLVREFRAHASPQAYRLAGCLAEVPLTLPVMRLVQRVMLPDSRPAHLAEVLLSGLLRQVHLTSATSEFEFVEGVQKVLRGTLRRSDTSRVYNEVSAYLAAHAGDARDTPALAVLPSGHGNHPLATPGRPFAEIVVRGESHIPRSDPHREQTSSEQDLRQTGDRFRPEPAQNKRSRARVRNELVVSMVDVLADSPTMQYTNSRELWRDMLANEIAVPIEPHGGDRLRPWLIEVVNTCIRVPDGLASLCRTLEYIDQQSSTVAALWPLVDEWEAIELFDFADLDDLRSVLSAAPSSDLAAMVRRASRSRVQELPSWCQTAWQIFLRLAGQYSGADELPPSMAFLALAADRLTEEGRPEAAELLRRFNRDRALAWGLDTPLADWQRTNFPHAAPPLASAHVLIQVEPDRIEADHFYLSHWLQSDEEGWHPVLGETVHLGRGELPGAVERLIEAVEARWADLRQPVILEFILPRELINEPVEWWWKESDSTFATPLAMDYQVVVRSLERLQRAAWHRPWHTKWRQLKEHPGQCRAHWSEPGLDGSYLFRLERELKEDPDAVCLILSQPPSEDFGADRELLAGLRAGVPMMIWQRGDCSDAAFREAVGQIVQDLNPDRVTERFRRLRYEALALGPDRWDQHVGRHLAILLDDPDRKPTPSGPVM